MYLNGYELSQFYETAVKKSLADGLDKKAAHEITISVWEQLPNPNIAYKLVDCIGLFVAALAYLSYRGWVDIKWSAMEDASRSTITNASEQVIHALNNTATQFAAHPSTLTASDPPLDLYQD
jgi:hypothetical protein